MKKQMTGSMMLGTLAAVGVVALSIGCVAANAESMGMKKSGHRLLLKSAVENADYTEVTLPIFEGQRSGESVWFVVTDSSDKADADARGVHYSPKMSNGKGTLAVQTVGMVNGKVQFLGSVDFAPERIVVPSETGFPPKEAKPGAIGEALYNALYEGRQVNDLNKSGKVHMTRQEWKRSWPAASRRGRRRAIASMPACTCPARRSPR